MQFPGYRASLDDNLPRVLSKVHPKYKTPHVAVIFFAIMVCAFALSGTFRYLAVFATGSLLLIDLGVSFAVLRLRQRDGLSEVGEFRLLFGPLIPLLSSLIVGWLLLQVPAEEAASTAGLITASVVVYAVRAMVHGSWNSTKPAT